MYRFLAYTYGWTANQVREMTPSQIAMYLPDGPQQIRQFESLESALAFAASRRAKRDGGIVS